MVARGVLGQFIAQGLIRAWKFRKRRVRYGDLIKDSVATTVALLGFLCNSFAADFLMLGFGYFCHTAGKVGALTWFLSTSYIDHSGKAGKVELWRYLGAFALYNGNLHHLFFLSAFFTAFRIGRIKLPVLRYGCTFRTPIEIVEKYCVRSLYDLNVLGICRLSRSDGRIVESVNVEKFTARAVITLTPVLVYLYISGWLGIAWLFLLFFGRPAIRGIDKRLDLEDGNYTITTILLGREACKYNVFVYRGVLHGLFSGTSDPLYINGDYLFPTVRSIDADIVTWGGIPQTVNTVSGVKLEVITNTTHDDQAVEYVYSTNSIGVKTADGRLIYTLDEPAVPGADPGFPIFARDASNGSRVLVGITGSVIWKPEEDSLVQACSKLACWSTELVESLNGWTADELEALGDAMDLSMLRIPDGAYRGSKRLPLTRVISAMRRTASATEVELAW